jgi:hypothetical protein
MCEVGEVFPKWLERGHFIVTMTVDIYPVPLFKFSLMVHTQEKIEVFRGE